MQRECAHRVQTSANEGALPACQVSLVEIWLEIFRDIPKKSEIRIQDPDCHPDQAEKLLSSSVA